MSYKDIYNEWLNNPYFDEATKAELQAIKDDEKEIEDRFYMDLEFGTAGLRGVIGAGTNRMNIYVVRKATHSWSVSTPAILYALSSLFGKYGAWPSIVLFSKRFIFTNMLSSA